MRLTVLRLMPVVAIAAILSYFDSNQFGSRRERMFELADRHARLGAGRLGAEYRRNAAGNSGMLRVCRLARPDASRIRAGRD
jgi:hypothetical protein